ncbi:sensor histidine kinase [Microbacterium sp. NEAU-LLC]|uniref:Oxygen sensor histidine kinase NreB n=1 Tax=Microbacterium helvum TaxID=2773713 RepID=A0ABR8NHV2_9MICO|nr:ATP-binding protein [Microbacterium helvum]MBD3940270.1 sensor histidine kinase [Microbacterium helvum]
MLSTRGWDVVVTVVSVVIAGALALFFPPVDAVRMAVALGAIALFAVGYLLIGRAAMEPPRDAWRYPAMLAVATVAVGVGAGAAPFVAILQTLAYPVVWIIGDSRRRGLWGSAVIAAGLFAGVWIGYGANADSAVAGATTAVFSLALSAALGLWVTRIAAWGDERARLLAELTAAQGQIEALSRERGASAERERLARDIHDTLAQTLAGLVIFAERAGRQSRNGQRDAADATIATVEQVAREALAEARALVARTAAVPAEPAFDAAVERLIERFRAHAAAGIVLVVDGEPALDREGQVVLLRCLQEALSNAAQHAAASRVEVRIASDADGGAALTVADDGHGFDPAATAAGFGLEGMRDRVALAGGDLDVSSLLGAGTTLRVRLPAPVPAERSAE